ncbi:MAG TPA: RluA family pseudouridine synthase, partial [Bacillales bacterium]|nr:RluA family pseudouridine synthase [Bacillales bacterium]
KGDPMIKTNRKGKWLELIIPQEWNGISADKLFRSVWQAPKKLIHSFRMEQKVLYNGSPINWEAPLEPGAKLQLHLFEQVDSEIPPTYMDVSVLYEDDHVIVFNKPPFMRTHPNDVKEETDTLLNAAVFYLHSNGDFCNIRHIHRLDRDTSGAILLAKHALAGAILDRMLEKREIKRTYIALVHGILKPKKGMIHLPIGRDRHHATRRRVSTSGQDAVTHYHVLKDDREKQISLVKCWLDTGRTHQIRVHFSHLEHPLVGDLLYGGKPILNRQALHAAKLEFTHPITEEKIICYAPLLDPFPFFKDFDVSTIE